MILDMMDRDQQRRLQQQRDEAVLRRERLLARARELLNRARIEGLIAWDESNVAYAMHPDTARLLLEARPELFAHHPEDDTGGYRLDKTRVLFSRELGLDQIILAFAWWPIVDEQ